MRNDHERMVAEELNNLRAATAEKWVREATPALIEEFGLNGHTHCAPDLRDAINRELAKKSEFEFEEVPL